LDVEVATQRILGDRLSLSVHRFTVYTSPEDKAIGFASRLFASPRGRVGTLGQDQLADSTLAQVEYSRANIAFVNFESASDALFAGEGYGHSYFRDAPTVASDVVLILRDDLDPGTPGRPLKPLGPHFWEVPPGYPDLKPAQ
jgi:esterase/lipase superfamily enzyme